MTNAEIILENIRRFESGDITGCGEFFDDGCMTSIPGIEPVNKTRLLEISAMIIEAIPDFSYNAKIIETQGDVVKVLLVPTGTHTGTLRYPGITPLPPTGISFALPKHLCTYTVFGGKITNVVMEDTSNGGLFGILQALGIGTPDSLG